MVCLKIDIFGVLKFEGVGKTCLLLRYANDSFSPTLITTIGIDFKIKQIKLDDKVVKLQVTPLILLETFLFNTDLGYCWTGTFSYNHHIVF